MKANDLLARGYLPRELPPIFSSTSFGSASSVLNPSDKAKQEWTVPSVFNLARPGSLRRRLAIPNPISQWVLAHELEKASPYLLPHFEKSLISLSRPIASTRGRALIMSGGFDARVKARIARMKGAQFTLKTDISQYYSSIYTHSFEWALHTKKHSKSMLRSKGSVLNGGSLDTAVRSGQGGQTKGIPIGPDTSLAFAELILCAVDGEIQSKFPDVVARGLRLIDDFEYAARSRGQAEDMLAAWDSKLQEYELTLNPRKTFILEGAIPPEVAWIRDLKQFRIRQSSDSATAQDLVSYFSLAIEDARANPDDSVLKYAIARIANITIGQQNWKLLSDLLLSACIFEPSSLGEVSKRFINANKLGYTMDHEGISQTLNEMCFYHAPLEHGSEVSWSLYTLANLGLSISEEPAKAVVGMRDNCSQLLLKHLMNEGRCTGSVPDWSEVMLRAEASDALQSEDWLLAYECIRHGWVSDSQLLKRPAWVELRDSGVGFFYPTQLPQAGSSHSTLAAGFATSIGELANDLGVEPELEYLDGHPYRIDGENEEYE